MNAVAMQNIHTGARYLSLRYLAERLHEIGIILWEEKHNKTKKK